MNTIHKVIDESGQHPEGVLTDTDRGHPNSVAGEAVDNRVATVQTV